MRTPKFLDKYRPNVGICVFNREGQVWLGRRADHESHDHAWQMPQGGIDDGEDIQSAALRELVEETGIASTTILSVTPGWMAYDFPEDYRPHKKRKWKGQRQKWVAVLFDGQESEIDLASHDEIEFDDWRWGDLQETPDLIVPFKKGVYKEVVQAFTPLSLFIRDKF